MDTSSFLDEIIDIVGAGSVTTGASLNADDLNADDLNADDLHEESLHAQPGSPVAVVRPQTTQQVSWLKKCCAAHSVGVVARGSGSPMVERFQGSMALEQKS